MKIYTRTGDKGETGLLGGIRVSKDHFCVDVCGELDELNSALGVILAHTCSSAVESTLNRVQAELFHLGSSVAAALSGAKASPISEDIVTVLEEQIDALEACLEPLTSFIMPGGSILGSHLHLARAISRRCERRFVSLVNVDTERDFSHGLMFLNRLADYLFVAARYENTLAKVPETPWLPDARSR